MSEERVTYTSLPEDLALIEMARSNNGTALMVRIAAKNIGITAGAYRALGRPERLEFLFGPKTRMLAIRGAPATTGYRPHFVGPQANDNVQIMAAPVVRTLGLGPPPEGRKSHSFTARLVEGALLIGPLPEATS